ncbi:unnamed protein product [Trichobilharzia szidati]|nr:unnamed protein product [Trichobilharzia szidati]
MQENSSDNVLDTGIQHHVASRKRRISSGRLYECLGYNSYSTFYRRQKRLRDAAFSDWDIWKRYCASRQDVPKDNTEPLVSSSTEQGTIEGITCTSEAVTDVSPTDENQLQVFRKKMTYKELLRKSLMKLFVSSNISVVFAQEILDCFRKFNPNVPTTVKDVLRDSGTCLPRFLRQDVSNHHLELKENLQPHSDSSVDSGTNQHAGVLSNVIHVKNSTSSVRFLVVRSLKDNSIIAIPSTWVVRSGLCAYSSTASHLEPVYTGHGWSLFEFCQLQEFDTYENCQKIVDLLRRYGQSAKKVDMRPKRDANRNNEELSYNSMDSDTTASEVGCIKSRSPDYNRCDDFATTIPSTSNALNFRSSSPVVKRMTSGSNRLSSNAVATDSMKLQKVLDHLMEIKSMCTKILNIVSISSSSSSKSLWQPHHYSANDGYALMFPIENEVHLEMLEASLSEEKYKRIYIAKMCDCLQADPKLSLKVMMRTVLKPEVALKFTFQGTVTKCSILPYTFYKIMRYVIIGKFSGRLMLSVRELDEILDKATKSYFHNLKDSVRRRELRKEIQANEEETSRGRNSGSYGNTLSSN